MSDHFDMPDENPMPDQTKKLHVEDKPDANGQTHYCFYCPGCGHAHTYFVPMWTFNGNLERPTFTPSLLNRTNVPRGGGPSKVCHLFVTDGKIQYCGDCTHTLAGQTIDLPEFRWFKDEEQGEPSDDHH